MAIQYTDLVNIDQIREEDLDGLTLLDAPSEEHTDVIERKIRGVTGEIETFLDRNLIVRRYTSMRPVWRVFTERDPDNDDNTYYAWVDEWPVVQVETTDPAIRIHEDGDRILSDDTPESVDLFAGYKRIDQEIGDLQTPLPDLSTLPDNLPGDIQQVAARLTLHRLLQTEGGFLGFQDRDATIRGETVTTRMTDTSFVDRELKSIHAKHKKLAA